MYWIEFDICGLMGRTSIVTLDKIKYVWLATDDLKSSKPLLIEAILGQTYSNKDRELLVHHRLNFSLESKR
jgi:hypothetical protein